MREGIYDDASHLEFDAAKPITAADLGPQRSTSEARPCADDNYDSFSQGLTSVCCPSTYSDDTALQALLLPTFKTDPHSCAMPR